MLNWIWLGMLLGSVLLAGCTGRLEVLTARALELARVAVMEVALPLVGLLALWLGILRLAERAGLIRALAALLQPLMRRLFPDVPAGDPALGAMIMNMAANMLGLGNAATPLGLRAMQELARLNPNPGTASNAMCTFLAINTGSLQLIPVTAISVLAAHQAREPTAIVGTALVATFCSALTAVTAARLLERLPWFRIPTESSPQSRLKGAPIAAVEIPSAQGPVPELRPLTRWARGALTLLALFFLGLFLAHLWGGAGPISHAEHPWAVRGLRAVSLLSVPFLLAFFPLYAALRGVRVYEEFVRGARQGLRVAVRILPYLVAMLVAVGMFRAAGGVEWLTRILGPILAWLGFPPELLPLALVRPLSGSGALGVFTELVQTHGPDSLLARMAGTLYGSTETTFYVLAVYFGAVGVNRIRHALWAGMITDLVAMFTSVWLCRWMFT
ncbi:MAG: nucleoside recognition domain-containing protein [Verrucomicrobiota bacterium]|nr:spore maturation protein [Limisphaera sp.]MDW8381021.1 nucleoside recognition domain-containing protein [Verrucomicrobiota bacterium]